MEPPKELLQQMLAQMLLIRTFEEKLLEMYSAGEAVGISAQSIGQEAVAVGAIAALQESDLITSTHRGRHHCLAKGTQPASLMAELFGREAGCCKGKGGILHIIDPGVGNIGTMAIVGAGIPIATGAALSAKMRRTGQVVMCFFGDGATNIGFFHEGLNFASLHRLPVVFVCENNLYAIGTSQKRHQAIRDIAVRATGYNMPGVIADGMDAVAVYDAAVQAVDLARSGDGPTLIECKTYRFQGHSPGDPRRGLKYRTKEEIDEWMARDPIKLLERRLLEADLMNDSDIAEMEHEATSQVEDAIAFARECPRPDPAEALTEVFAP